MERVAVKTKCSLPHRPSAVAIQAPVLLLLLLLLLLLRRCEAVGRGRGRRRGDQVQMFQLI